MQEGVKDLLEQKCNQFNSINFIENDPILIPHMFSKKEDIEIAGFLAATIAWGNRKSIITNGKKLIDLMGNAPHEFILNYSASDLKQFNGFVHRTFNSADCTFFIKSLRHIYQKHKGLEMAFAKGLKPNDADVKNAIIHFRELFLETRHLQRTEKHISNPDKNSSSKRLCMFLRWMVRHDNKGVDFGIWKGIKPSQLCLPLDVHTGNVSRKLGLLDRTQNDWKAVEEVTQMLRTFDSKDPVKYDFALFGLGVSKEL